MSVFFYWSTPIPFLSANRIYQTGLSLLWSLTRRCCSLVSTTPLQKKIRSFKKFKGFPQFHLSCSFSRAYPSTPFRIIQPLSELDFNLPLYYEVDMAELKKEEEEEEAKARPSKDLGFSKLIERGTSFISSISPSHPSDTSQKSSTWKDLQTLNSLLSQHESPNPSPSEEAREEVFTTLSSYKTIFPTFFLLFSFK